MDVREALTNLGLEQYIDSFQDNEIDEESFLFLTDDDLKQLGVSALGHRKKILAHIEKLGHEDDDLEDELESLLENEVGTPAKPDEGDKVPCPSCGYDNEPFFRFCLRCGFQLRGGPTGKAKPKPASSGESGIHGHLVLVKPDGTDGASFPLRGDTIMMGRGDVDLAFPDDPYMAEHELTIRATPTGIVLAPETGTRNGVYIQLIGSVEIGDGDLFRIGQQLLQFRRVDLSDGARKDDQGTRILGSVPPPNTWGRLGQITDDEQYASVHLLSKKSVYVGRESQGISFPWDGYVSRNHIRLLWDGQKCVLEDLDSSNGTFIRIKSSVALTDEIRFLVGQHLFRFRI